MHFVKFHPEVASWLLSRGKRKYAPPGDEAIMKIHKKLFSGIPINFTFYVISPKVINYSTGLFHLFWSSHALFGVSHCLHLAKAKLIRHPQIFLISPKLQRIWSWNFGFATGKIWAFIWSIKKCTTSSQALGDANVIGIRSFKKEKNKYCKWKEWKKTKQKQNQTNKNL